MVALGEWADYSVGGEILLFPHQRVPSVATGTSSLALVLGDPPSSRAARKVHLSTPPRHSSRVWEIRVEVLQVVASSWLFESAT